MYASVYTVARRVVHEPYEKFMNYAKQPLPSERTAAAAAATTTKQPQVAVLFFYIYIYICVCVYLNTLHVIYRNNNNKKKTIDRQHVVVSTDL